MQVECYKKDNQSLESIKMRIEELWNQNYGNFNYNDLILLQKKEMVEGLPI